MNRFKVVYNEVIDSGIVKSQQEFSTSTGISRTIVSQLLNDHRKLNDKHIHKICSAFPMVNPLWLSDGVGNVFIDSFRRSDENEEALKESYDRELEEREAEQKELERRASLYDVQKKEIADLYSKLAEAMSSLNKKEKEIAELNQLILDQNKTIRQLKVQIAGLLKVCGQNQSEEMSSGENM